MKTWQSCLFPPSTSQKEGVIQSVTAHQFRQYCHKMLLLVKIYCHSHMALEPAALRQNKVCPWLAWESIHHSLITVCLFSCRSVVCRSCLWIMRSSTSAEETGWLWAPRSGSAYPMARGRTWRSTADAVSSFWFNSYLLLLVLLSSSILSQISFSRLCECVCNHQLNQRQIKTTIIIK